MRLSIEVLILMAGLLALQNEGSCASGVEDKVLQAEISGNSNGCFEIVALDSTNYGCLAVIVKRTGGRWDCLSNKSYRVTAAFCRGGIESGRVSKMLDRDLLVGELGSISFCIPEDTHLKVWLDK